jgi:hypothetical protein
MPKLDPLVAAELTAARFPQSLYQAVESAPIPSIGAGPIYQPLADQIRENTAVAIPDLPLSPLVQAGLWLLAGDLDASHNISQSDESPEGSFWHGIMHRREGDFGNAKYWFRRVGTHPVLQRLAATDYGDPMRFVDACERATRRKGADADQLAEPQWLEWQSLLVHCVAKDKRAQSA